jgi:serine/threonine protein kinase
MPTIYRTAQTVDHYRIIRKLGQGAASNVYLACDIDSQQEVVLKFPSDDLIGGAAIYARYRREASLGKYLQHPGLQRHLNQYESRSQEYMVLEYLPGRNLRSVMKEHAPALLSNAEILRIMQPVCEVLAYLHEHGVIHQDIKPENILVLNDGQIKLIDLGIALWEKEASSSGRDFSAFIGTPDYMASERLRGKRADVRSDIYAVGVTLYELLCGHTPFPEIDGLALTSQNVSDDPPTILQFNATLDPALATVVMHAVRRDPEKRYASIADLLTDLQHLDTVTAIPYGPARPLLIRRYWPIMRVVLLILAIFLLIIVIGILAQLAHHVVK